MSYSICASALSPLYCHWTCLTLSGSQFQVICIRHIFAFWRVSVKTWMAKLWQMWAVPWLWPDPLIKNQNWLVTFGSTKQKGSRGRHQLARLYIQRSHTQDTGLHVNSQQILSWYSVTHMEKILYLCRSTWERNIHFAYNCYIINCLFFTLEKHVFSSFVLDVVWLNL